MEVENQGLLQFFLQKKSRAFFLFFNLSWCLTAAIYLGRQVNDQQDKHRDCNGSALLLLLSIKAS